MPYLFLLCLREVSPQGHRNQNAEASIIGLFGETDNAQFLAVWAAVLQGFRVYRSRQRADGQRDTVYTYGIQLRSISLMRSGGGEHLFNEMRCMFLQTISGYMKIRSMTFSFTIYGLSKSSDAASCGRRRCVLTAILKSTCLK